MYVFCWQSVSFGYGGAGAEAPQPALHGKALPRSIVWSSSSLTLVAGGVATRIHRRDFVDVRHDDQREFSHDHDRRSK